MITKDSSLVVVVIELVIEIRRSYAEEDGGGEERIGASLMLRSYPRNLGSSDRLRRATYAERLCDLLQSAPKRLDAPDDVLDIVDAWEPDGEEVEEVDFIGG